MLKVKDDLSMNEVMQKEPSSPLLRVENVEVNFGGLRALDNVSLDVHEGKITALIGPNGAGKSTLLDVISGFRTPSKGEIEFRGQVISNKKAHKRVELGMARTFQDLEVFPTLTVLENTLLGINTTGQNFRSISMFSKQGMEHVNRALEMINIVGLEERVDELAGNLSYGDQKLLSVARLLATDTSLLMLDEPGAGLSGEMVNRLGDILNKLVDRKKTILFVDHNMNLVMNFAENIIVLHHGKVIATGTPEEIQNNPEVINVYLSG